MNEAQNTIWTRREWALAILATCGIWLIAQLFWPLLGKVVPWDSKLQFFPFFRFLGNSIASGSLPFWNPFHYAGHPAGADPQSLVFNPIFLILAALWPEAPMLVFDLAVALHLLLAGIAALFLCKRWGFGAAAATLAALVVMLGGSASARLQHTGQIISYAWFVVALVFLAGALEQRSLWRAVMFAITAGLMAAGRDQVAYLCAITLIVFAAGNLLVSKHPLSRVASRLPVLVIMLVLGTACVALPLLLTAEFATLSNRPAFDYAQITAASLYPVNLSNLLAANIFGALNDPYLYWGPGYETRPWVDATDRSINTVFLGSLPVLIVFWVGIAGQKLLSPKLLPLLVFILLMGAYALGEFTPVFPFLFQYLPGVDLWRRPADASFLMNIGLALASGAMLSRYIEEGQPVLRVPGSVVAVALVGAAAAFALWFSARLDKVQETAMALGLAALVFGLLLFLLFQPRMRFERATLAWLLVLFTGGELVFRYAASAINAEPSANYASFSTPEPAEAAAHKVLVDALAKRHAAGDYPRVEMLGLGGTGQNIASVIGVENTLGYNPLRIGAYDHLVAPGQNNGWIANRRFPPSFADYGSDLARRLGIEYLVLGVSPKDRPSLFPALDNAQLLHAGPPWWIYQLPPALPRAVLASEVIRGDQATANQLAEFVAGADANRVLVDASVPLKGIYRSMADPPIKAGTVTITRWKPDEIALTVASAQDAILVLHETYFPGWEAKVNGVDEPIFLVNQLFRGVEIPKGQTNVVFMYRPLFLHHLRQSLARVLNPPAPIMPLVPLDQ
jgi:hypothetical protein